jgi:hypothetical protein
MAGPLCHASKEAKAPPEAEVGPYQRVGGLVDRINGPADTRRVTHGEGNTEQQVSRSESVGIEKEENIMPGEGGPSVAHLGDVVFRLENDGCPTGPSALRRTVGTGVIDDDELDHSIGSSREITFGDTEAVQCLRKVASLVEGRDDHGDRRESKPGFSRLWN